MINEEADARTLAALLPSLNGLNFRGIWLFKLVAFKGFIENHFQRGIHWDSTAESTSKALSANFKQLQTLVGLKRSKLDLEFESQVALLPKLTAH